MKKLIIFGIKNFAEIVHYYFTHDSDYQVVAFTVNCAYIRESTYQSLPVIPFEEVEKFFLPKDFDIFIAIGVQKNNKIREKKIIEAEEKGITGND